MITYVYTHDCECKYDGQVVEVRPEVRGGAAFVVHPVCIEKEVELKLMEVRRD